MAIRQTRIFVSEGELVDWSETLIGRVVRPLVAEFQESLNWFWFSRYVCLIDMQGEDRGDCDFNLISDNFKQAFSGVNHPGHRSMRFRFEIEDVHQTAFEALLQELVTEQGYAISDIRDYNQIADVGGNRFLGVENRQLERSLQRATLVTHLLQTISQLWIDALIGPDQDNHYHIEYNDDQQNPNGSSFESLHHLFCNITQVPISILLSTGDQTQLLGTFWGQPRGQHQRELNGQLVNEVFLPY
jgi:hypothetical protein